MSTGQRKSSGAEIKEENAICTLLLALSKSYETVVTVLENMAIETLDMNYVKTRLKIDSEKKKENDGDQSEPTKTAAFMSNKSIKCHNCGGYGHIKKYCKKPSEDQPSYNNFQGNISQGVKNRRENNQTYKGSKNASNQIRGQRGWNNQSNFKRTGHNQQMRGEDYVEMENTHEDNICFISNRDNNVETVSNENILFFIDSGCTDHLINDKEYFSDFMILNKPIKIAIAKDKSYLEATGIGNINVQSYVNGKRIKYD